MFYFENVQVQILMTYPSGDIKWVAGYTSLDLRGKVQAGNTSLGESVVSRRCAGPADLLGREREGR